MGVLHRHSSHHPVPGLAPPRSQLSLPNQLSAKVLATTRLLQHEQREPPLLRATTNLKTHATCAERYLHLLGAAVWHPVEQS